MESICSYDQVIQTILNCDLVSNRKGNPGTKNSAQYIDLVTAFDIETTRLPDIEQAFMYVWQWQFGPDCLIMGRTWEDFNKLTELLTKWIKFAFGIRARLVVWVHNLSFEFSYLKGIYPFTKNDVFCMDMRKVAKCTMYDSLEFRCSYIHSNMSLDQFTKKMGCEVKKLTGTFDYSKIRYPWTPLTDDEIAYCAHDVQSLVEAITKEMELEGDNLSSIPLTSTGYIRRDAKRVLTGTGDESLSPEERKEKRGKHRLFIKDQLPDWQLYVALREAFRGGNTHGSRFFVGEILTNVRSKDRSSSYPDVMVNCEFPVKEFQYSGAISIERLETNIKVHHLAALIRVSMSNVELADPWIGCPYLTKDKSRNISGGVYDNGRILSADHLDVTLTDVDYWIVTKQYKADIVITDSWFSKYGFLPDEYRGLIKHYYKLKTELKGDESQKVFYEKIKNKINAGYGMMAQDPVKENIVYDGSARVFIPDESKTPEEQLVKYNSKAFLVYQWGCWVTANARNELQEAIDLVGDQFVYCDTDSVKYIGDVDFTEYNDRIMKRSRENGAYAVDSKGVTHYMGVYEDESGYDRFITQGSKKYAYERDGKTFVTCSGVNKAAGGPELEKAGGLEMFKAGFVFKDAGGTESVYNDNVDMWITREGHKLHITDNVVIRPSEYTLGLTGEYMMLLHRLDFMRSLVREIHQQKYLTSTISGSKMENRAKP